MRMGEMFFGTVVLGFLLFCITGSVHAQDPGPNTMNGYKLSQFKGFEKNWQLVTSRYRKDTGEMRLTYANPLAWKALQKGSADYPDGAIFAKIAMLTEEDPDFTSSAVPSRVRRYQFMVRNKKKHAETTGWGYAIFSADGMAAFSTEDQDIQSRACSACHEMVPHRGYVFSQQMVLTGDTASIPVTNEAPPDLMSFSTVKVSDLPEAMRAHIPKGAAEARRVHGVFEKNVFSGTMGEMRPSLVKEAMRTRVPAVLVSDQTALFALAYVNTEKPECTEHGRKGLSVITLVAQGHVADKTPDILRNEHCEPLP